MAWPLTRPELRGQDFSNRNGLATDRVRIQIPGHSRSRLGRVRQSVAKARKHGPWPESGREGCCLGSSQHTVIILQ